MLESYICTGDGKDYVDVDCVREALGIKEDENIFRAIEKLREDNDLLKELHANHISMLKDYADLAFELGIGSGDAESIKDYIVSVKKERDRLKEKCDGLKADLEATNRLYKEHHDFVDKVCEAVDIQRPYLESGYDKAVKLIAEIKRERDELKEKYDKLKRRTNAAYGVSCGYSGDKAPEFLCNVIGYSWELAPIEAHSLMDDPSYCVRNDSIRVELELTPTANYKGTFDMEDLKKYIQAYGREKKLGIIESVDYQNAKAARAELAYLYKQVLGKDRLDRDLSPHEVMKAIHDEYKRVVHNFEDRTADWHKAQQELDRYRLAVGSLLGIPKEARDDINAIERSFESTKKLYDSLKEFRDNVCEILDIPYNMAYKHILKELHDIADRYDELEDFRADICGALDIEGMLGTPQQNDKYILEQVEKMKDNKPTVFRNDVAKAIGMTPKDSNPDIINRVMDIKECHDKLCKAIWEAMDRKPETLPEETARLVGEVTELARGEKLLIEFRDAVAEAIGMDYPTTNQVILNSVQYIYKDRKDAYELVAKINDKVTELVKAKEDLQKDYDELGEAYSSVLKWNNSYAEVRRLLGVSADADADEMVDTLDQLVCERERCKRRYENWYSRYESEHERANGEHKRAEKLRSDVTALKNHIELLRNANDSRANALVSLQAFKNECRKLKEEKAKVIAALGQDIWDDCLK